MTREDDALQFGLVVVLTVAADLLTQLVVVERAIYSLVTTPALALQAAFVRSATSVSSSLGQLAPLAAITSAVLGLYLLSRWRWSEA